MKNKKQLLISLLIIFVVSISCIVFFTISRSSNPEKVNASSNEFTSIPNTTKTESNYDSSFLSITGFASIDNSVNSRDEYIGTTFYVKVNNERDFLNAISEASKGNVKVIEITSDLNLGWYELELSDEEKSTYSFVSQYSSPTNGYTNPNMELSGVTKINLSDINGLTIFSSNGITIKHTELKLQSSSNDIVIRNISFKEMWQWDDEGNHKEVGWTFIKINGANNIWIDHCSFENAADGNVDIENGSSKVTFSWCKFGLEADETPSKDSAIYASINYMEKLYKSGSLSDSSRYYQLRSNGASIDQIMGYAAYHSKTHLVGSGDKDYTDYVSDDGTDYLDGNQRLQLTLAYCYYLNVGQRVPMIRQGVGHMFNCYIDNTSHMDYEYLGSFSKYGKYSLSRAINARNGASIAADTCVFDGVEEVIVGAEVQGDDTANMNSPWDNLFASAQNHVLVVNSKVTNSRGTYTGSSWDNNGVNLFTTGFTWNDKSTISNWAWSSSIDGVDSMSKSNPPSSPFTFTNNTKEVLPYEYKTFSLDSVTGIVPLYSGARSIKLSTNNWLSTEYDANNNVIYINDNTDSSSEPVSTETNNTINPTATVNEKNDTNTATTSPVATESSNNIQNNNTNNNNSSQNVTIDNTSSPDTPTNELNSNINTSTPDANSSSSNVFSGISTLPGTSYGWNFKTSKFRTLGTISDSVTIAGLTILANTEKPVYIISDNATVGNTELKYSLSLGGSGNTSYRAIKIPVGSNSNIKVFLRSNNASEERTLLVSTEQGDQITTLNATTSASAQSFTYTGSSGYLYLFSKNSGINIYKIEVVNN